MSCPETKSRTSRGTIITTTACTILSSTGTPITDFTKEVAGTRFTAAPKWCGVDSEFTIAGEIPDDEHRLASTAPPRADDETPAEKAAFVTCGGTRDVFATYPTVILDQHLATLSRAELKAYLAWCTPRDFEVLARHGAASDLAAEMREARAQTAELAPPAPSPAEEAVMGTAALLARTAQQAIDRRQGDYTVDVISGVLQGRPGAAEETEGLPVFFNRCEQSLAELYMLTQRIGQLELADLAMVRQKVTEHDREQTRLVHDTVGREVALFGESLAQINSSLDAITFCARKSREVAELTYYARTNPMAQEELRHAASQLLSAAAPLFENGPGSIMSLLDELGQAESRLNQTVLSTGAVRQDLPAYRGRYSAMVPSF